MTGDWQGISYLYVYIKKVLEVTAGQLRDK